MTLHNYRSRHVHKTLNGVNPSSSFRDMRSAKSGPNLWQIWQVFGPWPSPYGQMGIWPWQCTSTGLENSTELWMEKIRQAVTEIWVRKFGSRPPSRLPEPARPDRDDNTPPARRYHWKADFKWPLVSWDEFRQCCQHQTDSVWCWQHCPNSSHDTKGHLKSTHLENTHSLGIMN